MVNGDDQEGTASGTLGDHRDKARVDCTEVVVMDAHGDGHAIVAVWLGGRLPKHVAEL